MIDAGVTLVWQEPVTAVIGANQALGHRQAVPELPVRRRWRRSSATPWSACSQLQQRIAYLARREQHQVGTGDAIGQITIPKLGASYTVVQGTDTASLEKGPGHYPATALPGLGQTVAIAGHRTTYLAPFRHINRLEPGDASC